MAEFKLLKFTPPPDRVGAEQVLVTAIKEAIYAQTGTLTVAQVYGVLQIVKDEIREEQSDG